MGTLKIYPLDNITYTLIPNDFIDHHLIHANGDFVKIYLLILRMIGQDSYDLSTEYLADLLQLTEADILRALKYWESKKVLSIAYKGKKPCAIHMCSLNVSPNSDEPNTSENQESIHSTILAKPHYSIDEIQGFIQQADYKQLIYVTQKYLGKMLTEQDINVLISFHDWLGLPFEVIELLIEYCVSNNHRNMKYIEKVALDWTENNIKSIEKAEYRIETFNKKYFAVMKAFGIGDRNPSIKQISYIKKWTTTYNLSMELIIEACNRTIDKINQPQFSYADAILSFWHKNNVKTFDDVKKLDEIHQTNKKTKNKANKNSKNKVANYNQRQYDYDQLGKKAMEMLFKETNEGGY